jgi:DNA-binding IclR family transcriptional regulator
VAILPEVALAKLRKGRANGSIRGVAKLLGTSKSTAHRVLHELAGLGMIRLSTSAAGCSIALA